MKIAMLTRLFLPHLGGVEKHVETLAKEVIKEGNQVTVISSQYEEYLPYKRTYSDIVCHYIPHLKAANKITYRLHVWSWLLLHLPLFLTADIIHVHDVFFWYWPLRILLPWKKVYITFHGFEAGKGITPKAIQARQLAAKFTHGNIAVGAWIGKWYGTRPDYIVYGSLPDTEPIKNFAKSKKNNALFVGRLEADTAILEYIEFVIHHPTFTLDIIGDGPLKPSILNKISKAKRLRYLGSQVVTPSVFSPYAYAFSSSYLTMLEAMAAKAYVVAFATDTLKHDYLTSHPMLSNFLLASSQKDLDSQLTKLSPTLRSKQLAAAYHWAIAQTPSALYHTYLQLWGKP